MKNWESGIGNLSPLFLCALCALCGKKKTNSKIYRGLLYTVPQSKPPISAQLKTQLI
jgi:hypothetical protein